MGQTTSGHIKAQHGEVRETSRKMGLSGEPGQEPYSLWAGQGEARPREGLGRGALTLLILQKMRRSSNQKKTAMTPVPIRIMISMLPLSWEPEWTERSRVSARAHVRAPRERAAPAGSAPGSTRRN